MYRVPVTLTTTTVSQYTTGTYRRSDSCQMRTPAKTIVKRTAVISRPTPRVMLIQSAKLSPTVVQRILMIQNHSVISGTLLSISRRPEPAGAIVVLFVTICTLRRCD